MAWRPGFVADHENILCNLSFPPCASQDLEANPSNLECPRLVARSLLDLPSHDVLLDHIRDLVASGV